MKKTIIAMATVLLFLQCTNSNSSEEIRVPNNNEVVTAEQGKSESCMSHDGAGHISKQVKISGDIEFPLDLTVDSLKAMDVVTIEDFKIVCQTGADMKNFSTCKGVLLKDILEKAKIKQSSHKDRNFYIVARASDDYKATFSWAEIFNNPTGENVYVLFEENGEPIKTQGDMVLICKNDIKTRPRHVYWLESIEVKRVN